MSWLRIDDGFEDHPKVELLTDAAHRLWMRAACWCMKSANSHTGGFVPELLLDTIAKRSASHQRLLKLAQELVAATGGGLYSAGLWERVEGGWRFHDWHEYRQQHSSRSEAARLAGQRSAQARRERDGSAQPRSTGPPRTNPERTPERRSNEPPNEPPNEPLPNEPKTFGRTTPERPRTS